MSRMSPGTDAKKKVDRDRYQADPERFKQAARDRYDTDPEVFRARSQRNRLKRTDEQKVNHLGYSRNYYLENAVELRAKRAVYYTDNKNQVNDRRRYTRLEAKKLERDVNEILIPVLAMVCYFSLVRAERIDAVRASEEEARREKKRGGATITQADVDDAVARFLKDGNTIEKIETPEEEPGPGLVGIKAGRG